MLRRLRPDGGVRTSFIAAPNDADWWGWRLRQGVCCGARRPAVYGGSLAMRLGMEPKLAIASVRSARRGAIETRHQEKYLRGLTVKTK